MITKETLIKETIGILAITMAGTTGVNKNSVNGQLITLAITNLKKCISTNNQEKPQSNRLN